MSNGGNSRQSFSQLIILIELCIELCMFSSKFRSYMLKLIYIFDHVPLVNIRGYGRCYVNKLLLLSTSFSLGRSAV